jgi:hypothetical protein
VSERRALLAPVGYVRVEHQSQFENEEEREAEDA